MTQTALSAARAVAKAEGFDLSDADLEYMLWEYTAFPICTWQYAAAQLRAHLSGAERLPMFPPATVEDVDTGDRL